MARKTVQKDETTDTSEGQEGVNTPEVIRNHETLSQKEVVNYLAEGFQSLEARAIVSEQVLGQATLLSRDEKNFLVGMSMLLLGWRFNEGYYNDEFASVLVLTEGDQYFVFNDSSMGVYRQLKDITERIGRQYGPIVCRKGLHASDYWRDEETGETFTIKPDDRKTVPARTYYLS